MKFCKKYMTLIIILAFTLSSCSSYRTSIINNENSFSTAPVQSTDAVRKESVITSENTNLWISSNNYQTAIKKFDFEFYNDSRVLETFEEMNLCINQLFLDDGYKNYIVAWNNFGFASVMIIFLKENSNFTPIYLAKPGRDITAVKQMDLGLDENFIEITSYYGTGSHMGQWTTLLAIKDKLVTTAWNYETISSDVGTNDTYMKNYALFTIIPAIFETPRINLQQIDSTGNSRKVTESIFLWNEQQNKFIEK